MGAGIPLPALAAQPPQVVDPLAQIKNALALRTMQNQQQTQQGEQQIQQGQIQLQQQQLRDNQAVTAAAKNWDGQDYDALSKGVLQNGGSGNAAFAIQQHGLGIRKVMSDVAAQDATTDSKNLETFIAKHKAVGDSLQGIENVPDNQLHATAISTVGDLMKNGVFDRQTGTQALQTILSTPDPAALRSQIDMLAKTSMGYQALAEQAKTAAQTQEAAGKGAQAQAEAAKTQADLPRVQAEAAVAPKLSLLSVAQKQAELGQTRAYTAAALANTAKTKVETANLGEQPIFAVDPATNERVMTTRPEAQANGYTNPVAVKEGDVSKETDARAMINDVQLNKSRYLAAMQQVYSQPMTNAQKAALVALTPEKLGVDFGSLFKLELPDVMQKVANASSFSVLSPSQKQAVVGYYSTLASVPAAQKALTNIGRSNKEMMDLELRTVPTPIMDQGTFGTMLDRFQGNIDQTSKKTVRMPGMPSTSDIRNVYEGRQQQNGPQVNFNMPRPIQGTGRTSLLDQITATTSASGR